MNEFFWEIYQQNRIQSVESQAGRALSETDRLVNQLRQLEATVEKLKLINIAFAELMIEKCGMSEDMIVHKIREVDFRDGIVDAKIGTAVEVCPQCHRRYDTKRNKCLYCGFADQSSTFLDKVT